MKKRIRPILANIDRKLARAARLLDAAAAELRDAALNPEQNIRKIGSALVAIFEIQHQIYRCEPALTPPTLVTALAAKRGRLGTSKRLKRAKPARPRSVSSRRRRQI